MRKFFLERFFEKYEFTVKHLMSSSDCTSVSVRELKNILVSKSNFTKEMIKVNKKMIEMYENELSLCYTESKGAPWLRNTISDMFYKKTKNSENIFVGNPEELIYISMQSLLNSGDEVVVQTPGYQSLYEIALSKGCIVKKWEMDQINWKFDMDLLKKLITDKTKILVLNSPHNPSGFVLNDDQMREIGDICRINKTILFSDEMYRFLQFPKNGSIMTEDHPKSFTDVYENAISLTGMSKCFSMPGIRIGWVSSQNKKLLNPLIDYKDFTSICNSGPSEILAMMGIRAHRKLVSNNLDVIQTNIEAIRSLSNEFPTVVTKLLIPSGGSCGMIRIKSPNGLNGVQLCEDIIQKKNLMLLPMSVFEFNDNGAFRIGLGRKDFPTHCQILRDYIIEESHNRKK